MADSKAVVKIKSLSLTEWIKIITVLSTLIKAIIEMVKEVEAPDADGETKKAAVMAFIETLIDESIPFVNEMEGLKEHIMAIAGVIVNAIVKCMNVIGKFVHKAKG